MVHALAFPACLLWGRDLRLAALNRALEELLTRGGPVLMDEPYFASNWGAVRDRGLFDRVLAGESVLERDVPARPFTQGEETQLWFDVSLSPARDGDGVGGVIMTAFDVTDRRRAETAARRAEHAVAALRQKEAEHNRLLQLTPAGIIETDASGRVIYSNRAAQAILAATGAELEAAHDRNRWDERDPSGQPLGGSQLPLDRALRGETVSGFEASILNGEGRRVHLRTNLVPVRDATGAVTGAVAAFVDITAERSGAAAAAAIQAQFEAVADALPGLLFVTAADGANVFVNNAFRRYTGLSGPELMGSQWYRIADADDLLRARPVLMEAVEQRKAYGAEVRFRRHDGEWRWHVVRALPVLGDDGSIAQWVGTCIDIHERREAEQALAQARAQLERVLALTPAAILESGPNSEITFANPAAQRLFGLSREGERFVYHPEMWRIETLDGEAVPEEQLPVVRALGGEAVQQVNLAIAAQSGERRIISVSAVPVHGADGAVAGMTAAAVDVTASFTAEQRVREREALLQAVIDSAPVGIIIADRNGSITSGNVRAAEIFDQPALAQPGAERAVAWYFHLDGQPIRGADLPLARALRGEERPEQICLYRHRDGRDLWVKLSAAPVGDGHGGIAGAVVAIEDIDREYRAELELRRLNDELAAKVAAAVAERSEALAQLHEAQKLETIGQLTGGVAHDFNNLLTPIVTGVELVRRRLTGDERAARLLDAALQSAERGRVLVQRLLAFARRQTLQPRPTDVSELVTTMLELIERSLGSAIRVSITAPTGLPRALVDPNQLELAILNLAVNARDAMPGGGTLTITVDLPGTDGMCAPVGGRAVRVRVEDTGSGMDAETLKRAVEPFFSTKGIGKGTGLGLSMVHGLAAQSGGVFRLESDLGRGTRAELWLPAVDLAAETAAPEHGSRPAAIVQPTVLIVDDEALVRMGLAETLRDAGYEVSEAASVDEAIALMGVHVPDAVVTDQMMPGRTGSDLIAELQHLHPGLPVLMVTGYANLADDGAAGVPVLAKPVQPAELLAQVGALLGERRKAA
jgi:PAS domain S-box-containing protein